MSDQPNADESIETRTIEQELLSLLDEDDWNREDLLTTTSENMDVPVPIVELGLQRLFNCGEVYQVHDEVRQV